MGSREFAPGRVVLARLEHGADLLQQITAVATGNGVEAAEFRAIGALQAARLAYYDQEGQAYHELDLPMPLEIVSLLGTVTRRDGAPAVHAHAALAGHDGTAYGGHVAAGCIVFACELVMRELIGEVPEREHDSVTGLPLWRNV
jgi:predicted DNA-binding protein with PD1-like motif